MLDRDYYVKKSEQVIAKAQKRSETYVGPCSQCKYRSWVDASICKNPIVQLAGMNQTDSYDASRIVKCNQQRKDVSYFGEVVCGPDGTLFEQKQSYFLPIIFSVMFLIFYIFLVLVIA